MEENRKWQPPASLCDSAEDAGALQQALKQALSTEQFLALEQCRELLRDSTTLQVDNDPTKVAVSSISAASTTDVAIAVPRQGLANNWLEQIAAMISQAEAEGLTRVSPDGTWFCPHCDREISEGHLESHMYSSKHQRYKAWSDKKALLEEQQARGELPDWMSLVDGMEFCKLCNTAATEAHLYSQRHQKALAWHQESGSAISQVDPCCRTVSLCTQSAQPFPIPANWGDPNNFEWRADAGSYFCKLCWKYADEAHVYSEKHGIRETQPQRYLEENYSSTSYLEGIGTTPPPPPRGDRPPQPATSRDNWAAWDTWGIAEAERAPIAKPALEDMPRPVADARKPAAPVAPPPRHVWQRYAVDEAQTAFWWCCEATGGSFLESDPGQWCKYVDPVSAKPYWWLDDETWFWVHSGSILSS